MAIKENDPSNKKSDFEQKFSDIAKPHLENYSGKQPLVSWKDEKPTVEEDFFYHLPETARTALQILIAQIEG